MIAVNKPTGPTSAALLNKLQEKFTPSALFAPWIQHEKDIRTREHHNQRQKRRMKAVRVKIGHGGTLDPLAKGVLVTAVGKGTKSLQKYLECTKEYEAIVVFGTATDTYDRLGKVVKRAPYEHVTKELVEEKLKDFQGKLMQLPPVYSAIKMNGKPLYEYARENKALPRAIERRPVECLEVELMEWMEPDTHNHKAPEEMMGPTEMEFLQQVWKNEGVAPANSKNGKGSERDEKDRLELFERRKRKMSEEQDNLVQDAPPHKVRRASEDQDATMSGGLPDPETAPAEAPSETSAVDDKPADSSTPTPAPASKGPPAARIRMTVTSGFYVRSLCHELGPAVGSAACMAELTRTRQGEWQLGKNVVDYDDLMKDEEVWAPKVEAALEGWESGEREARRAAHLSDLRGRKDDKPVTSSKEGNGQKTDVVDEKTDTKTIEKSPVVEEPLAAEVIGDNGQKVTQDLQEVSDNAETLNQVDKEKAEDKRTDQVVQPVADALKTAVDAVTSP